MRNGGVTWPTKAVAIAADTIMAYRLRWKRRRLLLRAVRKRRQLQVSADRTAEIGADTILCFMTVRNECVRLPHFLDHHRKLGVGHFLIVDNGSDDGTQAYLRDQPDVSLWTTTYSYRMSRFGMDWLTWLQIRYGHGHWCLTLDADEVLIYPHWETRDLHALTGWLDHTGVAAFGTMMLDMYPKGPIAVQPYVPGEDPFRILSWFDAANYMVQVQPRMKNLWIQGGVRARCFFSDNPRRAPTLNKIPLVKWNRRYVYVNSTHALLPRALNAVYRVDGGEAACGILLHTKFLNVVIDKSREEKQRREHFANSQQYEAYYDGLLENPDLWCPASRAFTGWRQLDALGLMSRGLWL